MPLGKIILAIGVFSPYGVKKLFLSLINSFLPLGLRVLGDNKMN